MKADRLILGNIITLDPRNPVLKALTVKDGVIQYAGSVEIARQLCDEHTIVQDYGSNYIYPGFIEAHCHGSVAGVRMAYFADLTSGRSTDDYLDIVRKYVAEHPDNSFYYGAGWAERDKEPNARMLDEICADKPIALNSVDGHSIWFNTKGMEQFGITKEAADKWGHDIIRVDENGTPTGYISEGPTIAITSKMSDLEAEAYKKSLLVWQEFAVANGITAYYEAGATEKLLRYYSELIAEGKWKLRVYTGILLDEHAEDYIAEVRRAKELADKYNCEYLQVIGVKIFMDGVVEAHTAWLEEPYTDKPQYYGVKRFCDFDRVVELYKEAEKLGLNVHQHTIGDGAVKFALDCIEKAQVETGNMTMRNALCHLQVMRKQDIKRLCDLNAVAVVAPLWMARAEVYYEQSVAYIGEKRTFYSYPLASFIKNNGIIAFHTDYPITTAMSFPRSICMACERKEPGSEDFYQWNANECITREEAIYAITAGPAYSVKQENHLGSLRVGYAANMCVYDTNFLKDEIDKIADATLLATIIDGEEVYKG